jgi:hypothetical protein
MAVKLGFQRYAPIPVPFALKPECGGCADLPPQQNNAIRAHVAKVQILQDIETSRVGNLRPSFLAFEPDQMKPKTGGDNRAARENANVRKPTPHG